MDGKRERGQTEAVGSINKQQTGSWRILDRQRQSENETGRRRILNRKRIVGSKRTADRGRGPSEVRGTRRGTYAICSPVN